MEGAMRNLLVELKTVVSTFWGFQTTHNIFLPLLGHRHGPKLVLGYTNYNMVLNQASYRHIKIKAATQNRFVRAHGWRPEVVISYYMAYT